MPAAAEDWDRFLPHSGISSFPNEFARCFTGQVVCVTGAAGDIGSALARALAPQKLHRMVLLDSSEHGLFELQRQIEAAHPQAPCEFTLGSVDDRDLLDEVFRRLRPDIVFHAAAFKHIALLENNPFAAIRNNALGTDALVRAAWDHGISNFVLLSTDKAVNPHSVMGISKRIAELITLSLSCSRFRASAIRLVNVIGSRGSVVPIFLDQIANGRPLSVTHMQAARYFLSREEAVSAILAAGASACDGKILVPQWTPMLRIADLAGFLAKAYAKNEISPLCVTGLKPGEKLIEDLIGKDEAPIGTVEGGLTVIKTKRLPVSACEEAVARLAACVADRNQSQLFRCLCRLVPEYVPSELMREDVAALS